MKKTLNYILLISIVLVTINISLNSKDIPSLDKIIENTNLLFLGLAFLAMILHWFFEAYIIQRMKKTLNIEGSYFSSLKLSMIGQYYGAITPFSTGGQPVQVYSLVNEGVPVGTASSLFINRFLIYQSSITIYAFFMLFIRFNFVYTEIHFALSFILIGCLLNFIVLLFIFGFVLNENFVKAILNKVIIIGSRLKIIKNIEEIEAKLNSTLVDYKKSIEEMKRDKKGTLALVLISFIQLTFSFSITYFIYLSLGFGESGHFLDIIALQSLHHMAVSFMPTPGTAGAAEGGFYMLFKTIFPKNIMSFALILWRFIDYYLKVMITGLVTFIDLIVKRRKRVRVS